MKKVYEAPSIEVVTFSVDDIITLSGVTGGGDEPIVTPPIWDK